MDKTISLKGKKVNYYPLMWVLLTLSLLSIMTFAFRSFVIQNYNGHNVTVYAYEIFSRNNTIFNDPNFYLLKITILCGIILGVINVCMSLWQAGYQNARRMKTVNALRLSITIITLISLIFITDITSGGNVSVRDTILGALGINCIIYFVSYLINLYYCSNKKLTITNYKAISIILIFAGCALWSVSFLNIGGESIIGINTILLPSVSFLNFTNQTALVGLNNSLFILLSQFFALLHLYNIIWCIVYTITNKSYRRHNIIRYLISAGFSGYYAYYCIFILGSTIQGSIGILCIGAIYLALALYTILAFKKLKYKIYSNVNEEMIYDDDDQYYDEKSRFIDNNPFPLYEGNLITIGNNNEILEDKNAVINTYTNKVDTDSMNSKKIVVNENEQSSLIASYQSKEHEQLGSLIEHSEDNKAFSNPILLFNNAPLQDQREVGDYLRSYEGAPHYSEIDKSYYSNNKKKTADIKDINLDDIFISEANYAEEIKDNNETKITVKPNNKPLLKDLLAEDKQDDIHKNIPKVLAYNNTNISESYTTMNKALYHDAAIENLVDYISLPNPKCCCIKITKPQKERKFNINDIRPSRVIRLESDTLYNDLQGIHRREFKRLFIQEDNLILSRVPQYIIDGDNTNFFSGIMEYIDIPCISAELALIIYQYVIGLYEKDKYFVSKCNKKIIDFLYKRGRNDSDLLPVIRDLCTKEIKLMLNNDILATVPVIERLIRIYVKINSIDNALKLCDTIINFDLSGDINNSFLRLKTKISIYKD